MIIPVKLLIACLAFASAYLLIITFGLELLSRKLKIRDGLPADLLEPASISWMAINFMMELLFYVVVPVLAYSFFYMVVPMVGVKAGMAAALYAFTLGSVPVMMGLSIRVKLPMPLILYQLLSHLIKLGGTLAVIGYLYSL